MKQRGRRRLGMGKKRTSWTSLGTSRRTRSRKMMTVKKGQQRRILRSGTLKLLEAEREVSEGKEQEEEVEEEVKAKEGMAGEEVRQGGVGVRRVAAENRL